MSAKRVNRMNVVCLLSAQIPDRQLLSKAAQLILGRLQRVVCGELGLHPGRQGQSVGTAPKGRWLADSDWPWCG